MIDKITDSYFSFSGRLSRNAFLNRVLCLIFGLGGLYALTCILVITDHLRIEITILLISFISLLGGYMLASLAYRRFQDFGIAGRWAVMGIAFPGLFIFIILTGIAIPGNEGDNEYGPELL